ncbi:hypothetical protein LMG27952_07382 [Paraburkholderia hiiakae]|uniref:Uncharacterized protein n=1 Tax=Paraburkholderia hiiakae TaxID=1081782 RepID=A0ABM8PAV0_9BURK|nr:hypothetical protein LMG27952_07382 [Paraburkholderia hiiakae]
MQAWLFNFIIQGMSQRNSRESPCLPNIELTHKSRQLRKKTRDAKQRWLSQAIADLNEDERAMHFKAGDIIRRLAER